MKKLFNFFYLLRSTISWYAFSWKVLWSCHVSCWEFSVQFVLCLIYYSNMQEQNKQWLIIELRCYKDRKIGTSQKRTGTNHTDKVYLTSNVYNINNIYIKQQKPWKQLKNWCIYVKIVHLFIIIQKTHPTSAIVLYFEDFKMACHDNYCPT